MIPLPPPHVPNEPLPSTAGRASTGRLRTAAISLVATTLAVGSIAIGSQLVSASSSSVGDESVDQPVEPDQADDGEVVEDPVEGDPGEGGDDVATEPPEDSEYCFFSAAPFGEDVFGSGDADLAQIDDFFGELFDKAGEACTSLIPADLEEEFAAWAAFDECLGEQLGIDGGFALPAIGSVTVDIPSEDGFDFAIYDFGEGDGSITIVKNGDGVSVSTDGDVSEFDDFSLGEMDEEFEAAHEACAEFLPDGADLREPMPVPGGFEILAESDDD